MLARLAPGCHDPASGLEGQNDRWRVELLILPVTSTSRTRNKRFAHGSCANLDRLFSRPAVIADLEDLHAGISLALPDLSLGRARIVLKLNQAGIPVPAWPALPGEQGYHLNAGNAREAAARFGEFHNWSTTFGLRWAAVGRDIEPNIQDFAAVRPGSKWRLVVTLVGRDFDVSRVRRARKSYEVLIREIQAHGYLVETNQFQSIADERRVHSTLLERLAGIVDVRGDREALMLYTSFNPALGSGLIWVCGPDAQAIAVGSTRGSDSDPHFVSLNWEEFSRDLIVAHRFSPIIGVYSLEGCVRQGFLRRLTTPDWNQSIVIPAESVQKATRLRARVQVAIWIGTHLPEFVAVILVGIAWVLFRRCKRNRLRKSSPTDNDGRELGDFQMKRIVMRGVRSGLWMPWSQ